jgi:hypothetical protein
LGSIAQEIFLQNAMNPDGRRAKRMTASLGKTAASLI